MENVVFWKNSIYDLLRVTDENTYFITLWVCAPDTLYCCFLSQCDQRFTKSFYLCWKLFDWMPSPFGRYTHGLLLCDLSDSNSVCCRCVSWPGFFLIVDFKVTGVFCDFDYYEHVWKWCYHKIKPSSESEHLYSPLSRHVRNVSTCTCVHALTSWQTLSDLCICRQASLCI